MRETNHSVIGESNNKVRLEVWVELRKGGWVGQRLMDRLWWAVERTWSTFSYCPHCPICLCHSQTQMCERNDLFWRLLCSGEILENNVHLTDIIEHLVQRLWTGFVPPFEIIIILFFFFSLCCMMIDRNKKWTINSINRLFGFFSLILHNLKTFNQFYGGQ